jgi:hypothetical protein
VPASIPAGQNVLELRGLRHLVVERSLMDGWVSRATGSGSFEALAAAFGSSGGQATQDAAAGSEPDSALGRSWLAAAGAGGIAGEEFDARALPTDPATPAAFVPNDCTLGLTDSGAAASIGGAHSPSALPDSGGSTAPARVGADLFSPDAQPAAHVCLLTGSNMAGKSTYLRSVAQAVLLAQMGSYVPASAARFTLVDRLFARVGAQDDVSRGRSTFLVEMEETAHILASATPASLVLVDEVGRGTSATDGVGIAWGVLEHLAWGIGCRTLFATHIHELSAMALLKEVARARRAGVLPAPTTPHGAAGAGSSAASAAQRGRFVPSVQCLVMEAVDADEASPRSSEQRAEGDLLAGSSGRLDGADGDEPHGDGSDAEDDDLALHHIPLLTHRLSAHPLVGFLHEFLLADARAAAAPLRGPPSQDGGAAREPVVPLEEALWRRVTSFSYGIAVAARAGLPAPVLRRAAQITRCLDQSAATQVWGRHVSRLLTDEEPAGSVSARSGVARAQDGRTSAAAGAPQRLA